MSKNLKIAAAVVDLNGDVENVEYSESENDKWLMRNRFGTYSTAESNDTENAHHVVCSIDEFKRCC